MEALSMFHQAFSYHKAQKVLILFYLFQSCENSFNVSLYNINLDCSVWWAFSAPLLDGHFRNICFLGVFFPASFISLMVWSNFSEKSTSVFSLPASVCIDLCMCVGVGVHAFVCVLWRQITKERYLRHRLRWGPFRHRARWTGVCMSMNLCACTHSIRMPDSIRHVCAGKWVDEGSSARQEEGGTETKSEYMRISSKMGH